MMRRFISSVSRAPKSSVNSFTVFRKHSQHLQIVKQNLNTIITLGNIEPAKENRTRFVENLNKFCENGRLKEALDVVVRMDKFETRVDKHMYAFLLKVCGDLRALADGKIVHAHMISSGIDGKCFEYTKLVIMYVKCKNMELARQVFDEMRQRDVVSETTLIAGYAQIGKIKDARQIFDEMLERSVISWNAMIAGYGRSGYGMEALQLFNRMKVEGMEANHFTFSNVIGICGGFKALECGLQVVAEF